MAAPWEKYAAGSKPWERYAEPKRFGTGKSLDVMEDGSLTPSEDVHYTGAGPIAASSGLAQREKKYGATAGFDFSVKPEDVRDVTQSLNAIPRGIAKAANSIPTMAADAGVQGRNLLTGSNYELPSSMYEREVYDRFLPMNNTQSAKNMEFMTSLISGSKLPLPQVKNPAPAGFGKASPPLAVPTTEQLTKASREAYAAGKESGVIVPVGGYAKTLEGVRKMVAEEGIDATLHPKSVAVMKRLEAAAGKPLSLQEAETLRKIALDAEGDINAIGQTTADARIAGKIVDELDDSIEALSTNDQARALWGRSRRSQLIDTMIHRAEIKAGAHYTQAGMEHALRQEFKALALNPRRMRGLNADQRSAVEKVAKGGALENTLRALGKFDPTTGGVAAAASIGTGAGLAPFTSGVSMAIPVVGFGAKRGATALTRRNVDAAREALVGRGLPKLEMPAAQKPANTAIPEGLPFTPTPGVMPAKAAAMSRGLQLEQPPMFGAQQFPPAPARGMTADVPPPILGDIDFKPTRFGDEMAGDLQMAPTPPNYPGGVDFTPSNLSGKVADEMAGDLSLKGLLGNADPPSAPLLGKANRGLGDIRAEIRQLAATIRGLSKEQQADPMYMRALSDDWTRLQGELAQRQSPAASK